MDREYRPAPMSLAQRAALRSQQPRVLRQPAHRRIVPLILVLVILGLFVLVAAGFEYRYRDRILPNVHVSAAGLDVSSLTQDEAAAQLRTIYVTSIFRTVSLEAPGGPTINKQAHELGYAFDRNLTAWRAFTIGHTGSFQQRALAQARTLTSGTDVDVKQEVNQRALTAYIVIRLAPAVNRKAGPGRAGRTLNVTQARRLITYNLLRNISTSFKVTLPFTRIPALPVPKPAPPPHKNTKQPAKHR